MKENFLKVGQIINTHGVRGEMKVYPLTDYKERFEELEYVYLEDSIAHKKIYIDNVKYKNNIVILKVKGIESLNDAEKLKTKYIFIDRADSRKLPEDTFLVADLIGLKVYTEQNELIGTINDVIQSAGNDIYEIIDYNNPSKKILIPAVGEFIKEVDLEKGIIVNVIEGLIE